MTKNEMNRRLASLPAGAIERIRRMIGEGFGARGIAQNAPFSLKQVNAVFALLAHEHDSVPPTVAPDPFADKRVLGYVGRWQVRHIGLGDRYGLDDCKVHDSVRPMVEIWDTESLKDKGGQFVTRYYVANFMELKSGLDLCGHVAAWKMNADEVATAQAMLRGALALR